MKRDDPNNPFRIEQVKNNRVICGAKTQAGKPCERSPMKNGRCMKHGGMALAGIASPSYTTGRHSKYLKPELQQRYDEGYNDPQLIQLRAEISLMDMRITQLTEKVEEGESDQWWVKVKRLWDDLMFAVMTKNEKERVRLQLELDQTIRHGADQRAAWSDIADLVDRRRKLVDTEQRRLVAAQQMITVEQAMLMMTATINALREAVYLYADQTTARHILSDAQRRYTTIVSLPAPDKSDDKSLGETS